MSLGLNMKRHVLIIHGLPGTGKTGLLSYLIDSAAQQGARVLVTSPGSAAVDNMVEKLSGTRLNIVRVRNPARISPSVLLRSLGKVAKRSTNGVVPGITECFGVPYYPGNIIEVCPSACRATIVQHYIQSDHLKLLAPYTTHRCTTTTPSLVQLENFIGGSHQTTAEVGLTTSKYFCVKPKVEINGVTILCVELHVHSTCVWLSFPWNPGLHTWLWCCRRTFQPRYEFGGFSEILIGRVPVLGTYWAMIDTCLQYAELLRANANSCGLLVVDHYKLHWCLKLAVHRLFFEVSCKPTDLDVHQFLHWAIYKHILHANSVSYPTKFATVHWKWQIAWSFHLDSIVHHLPYQLFHFAPGEAGSFLFGADTWSTASAQIYLHAYTLFQWNCLLEHEALPVRTEYWWSGGSSMQFGGCSVKLVVNDWGMYQFLHWTIYEQEVDLALPWDPGGNFPSAWGQADFQAGEYVMYQVYAMYWAQPRTEAHWIKPDPYLGVCSVLGEVPM